VTNFKSGSGNLDFGEDDAAAETPAEEPTEASSRSADEAATAEPATGDGPGTDESVPSYPYFVRRNNVGDERDTRLEIHVRDKVADREAQFRHTLADRLGVSDVSKTDAREFAMLAAFEHPEQVAELMRNEGFDTLE